MHTNNCYQPDGWRLPLLAAHNHHRHAYLKALEATITGKIKSNQNVFDCQKKLTLSGLQSALHLESRRFFSAFKYSLMLTFLSFASSKIKHDGIIATAQFFFDFCILSSKKSNFNYQSYCFLFRFKYEIEAMPKAFFTIILTRYSKE